ncbi:MAG: NUDIX hydrolase [Bacteroidetes bacterium HGW-Bacteroidetes-4]|jgi:8-oxo-dGTP diphosphatase|nr:MAG: NUDIX hydrolase [Bacteroidetes bacterium HGW-Bacteroidetes-4]
MFTYRYPRPMVTTDIVVLKKDATGVNVLLIERRNPPFEGQWALPGGFVDENEALKAAALRELKEETQLEGIELSQLHTFGNPGRDPRGHSVSIVYMGWLIDAKQQAAAGDDAKKTGWFPINELPQLAFDHKEIIALAIKKL